MLEKNLQPYWLSEDRPASAPNKTKKKEKTKKKRYILLTFTDKFQGE